MIFFSDKQHHQSETRLDLKPLPISFYNCKIHNFIRTACANIFSFQHDLTSETISFFFFCFFSPDQGICQSLYLCFWIWQSKHTDQRLDHDNSLSSLLKLKKKNIKETKATAKKHLFGFTDCKINIYMTRCNFLEVFFKT